MLGSACFGIQNYLNPPGMEAKENAKKKGQEEHKFEAILVYLASCSLARAHSETLCQITKGMG